MVTLGKHFCQKESLKIFFQSSAIFQSSEVWKCSKVRVKNNFAF